MSMFSSLVRSAAGPAVAVIATGLVSREQDRVSLCNFAAGPHKDLVDARKPLPFLGLGWLFGFGNKYSSRQLREEEHPHVDGFVNHAIAMDMFCLTSLIYAYGVDPDFVVREGENLASFVKRIDNEGDVSKVLGLKKEFLVNNLNRLVERAPDILFMDFLDLPQNGDLQAAVTVSHHQKRIIVIFRGSESLMDWMQNLQVLKKDVANGARVHGGFLGQLEPAYERLIGEVRKYAAKNPNYHIYVTGHSLGGALATLFGFMAATENPGLNFHVVSFASPRVGNRKFADLFNTMKNLFHTRVANEDDVITATPLLNFVHCGNNIRLCDSGPNFYSYDATPEEGKEYYNTWFTYSLMNNMSVKAHFSKAYHVKMSAFYW